MKHPSRPTWPHGPCRCHLCELNRAIRENPVAPAVSAAIEAVLDDATDLEFRLYEAQDRVRGLEQAAS